jgi:hypothetical protein
MKNMENRIVEILEEFGCYGTPNSVYMITLYLSDLNNKR